MSSNNSTSGVLDAVEENGRSSARSRRMGALAAMTGPTYLWLLITVFLPMLAMLYFSLLTVAPIAGQSGSFTLQHYRDIFTKPFYLINVRRSLTLALEVTLCCLAIGYPAAFLLAKQVKGRWREAILLLVMLPFWSNALVRAFSWTMVLSDSGLFGHLVHMIAPGLSVDILYTYPAIVIGLVHAYLPYLVLTCYVALQGIDDALIEAARSLGASRTQTLLRVILPLSLPGVVAGCVLTFVPVTGSFMEARVLGGQQAIMFGTLIESQFTAAFNWPLGAALGFVLLAMILVVMALFFPLLRRHLAG